VISLKTRKCLQKIASCDFGQTKIAVNIALIVLRYMLQRIFVCISSIVYNDKSRQHHRIFGEYGLCLKLLSPKEPPTARPDVKRF
jgi:hypothetical protein